MHHVPTEEYAAQGGGICKLTRAGRVSWLSGQREPDTEQRVTVELQTKRAEQAETALRRAQKLLAHLHEWDVMQVTADGVYWKCEIEGLVPASLLKSHNIVDKTGASLPDPKREP